MNSTDIAVAIYDSHQKAERAVKTLQRGGFDMKKLSILGKDPHADMHVAGYYNTGDRIGYWGKLGSAWDGLWNLLFGSAFLVIPGIGPVMAGGPVVSWIVGAMEGAMDFVGITAVGAALYTIGIPKDSIVKYESALKSNQFLVIVHGTTGEVSQARDLLQQAGSTDATVHRAPHR